MSFRPDDPDIAHWLDAIETDGVNLTTWEEAFVASVRDQFDRTGTLSRNQREILERIYAERTP
jgi:hypothetical protein